LKILVDTSVWSLAFRRERYRDNTYVIELQNLIKEVRVQLIGPIRQELLSGIRSYQQYEILKKQIRAFPDYPIQTADFEKAAEFFNLCKSKSIQGSNTDFLICAISFNNNWPIFTMDKDFLHFSKIIPIILHKPR
jgi:predicted nucleic acid-binding protein